MPALRQREREGRGAPRRVQPPFDAEHEQLVRHLPIEGQEPSIAALQEAMVNVATAHIHDIHQSTCMPQTPRLFARMDCHGTAEDINTAVRAFAVAVSQQRQLVLLPPYPATAKLCELPDHMVLSATEPWHWLAGQKLPLSDVFVKSACQLHMESHQIDVLNALATAEVGELGRTLAQFHQADLANASHEYAGRGANARAPRHAEVRGHNAIAEGKGPSPRPLWLPLVVVEVQVRSPSLRRNWGRLEPWDIL